MPYNFYDLTLPQNPINLNEFILEKNKNQFKNINCVENPYRFISNNVNCLGTSGN